MKLAILLAVCLVTATPAPHPNGASSATRVASPATAIAARPQIGDPAPDFTFQSYDHVWRTLRDLLDQGHVLMVFGPSESDLLALERDSGTLLSAGVVPVAIVGTRDADAWKLIERCHLTYSLLSDPRADVASRYGVSNAGSAGAHATWFVVDRAGRVCGVGETRPAGADWAELASAALGHGEAEAASTR